MSRRHPDSLIFDTIRLEGSLFVPALLEKAARGDHSEQGAADYQLPKGLSLADEQGRAFRIAGALWKNFDPVRARKDVDALKITIGFASELLRDALDYSDFTLCPTPVEIQGRHFPITALSRSRVPVIVAPHDLDLDTPDERFAVIGSGTRRKSAYQLAQQFLNASADCTWALVTNGRQIRLVRDSDTLTRPAYLEFDLELILANDRYADFAALWRILHSSRAGISETDGEACVWERWKREGEVQGERVRAGLRIGVQDALLALGTGFLEANGNDELRSRIESGELTKDAYFQQLLRLVYRFLFLFTVEERGLLHAPDDLAETREARNIYAKGYALRRLRDRSLRRAGFDRFTDLWSGTKIVIRGLAAGEPRLALPALGGLFATSQCPDLDSAVLENRSLLTAMRLLRWSSGTGKLAAVDYRNMGPEELGSVYESLLELVPTIDLTVRKFGFVGITTEGSTAGNARKTSGSYYTPDSLVQELLKTALDPVVAEKIASQKENPTAALLSLKVCDPACGSGHFLLAAARRLAEKLVELRAIEGAVRPADYRHALREVINHCVYGADLNPMAVELCKVALWLESVEPGKPLGFLDHHIQCGNSLIGVTPRVLRDGLPDDAFKPIEGDDKTVCTEAKKLNKSERQQLALFHGTETEPWQHLGNLPAAMLALGSMSDDTAAALHAKEQRYAELVRSTGYLGSRFLADAWCAAFVWKKTRDLPYSITNDVLRRIERNPHDCAPWMRAEIERLRDRYQFFHWHLAFPEVFQMPEKDERPENERTGWNGGFDVILGNPPWERVKLQEKEWFAERRPDIAGAPNAATRKRLIEKLSVENPALYAAFGEALRQAEGESHFLRDSGIYPLCGRGDVNLFAIFAERSRLSVGLQGKVGLVLPSGIATDDTTKHFFADLIESGTLSSFFEFENEGFFKGAGQGHMVRFALTTINGSAIKAVSADFVFQATSIVELLDAERHFKLTAADIGLLNPNTRTCPIFKTKRDAEITKGIYARVPVLWLDGDVTGGPWRVKFLAMFHMANDSGSFRTKHSLLEEGWDLSENIFTKEAGRFVPLYEAKMLQQFNHRHGDFADVDGERAHILPRVQPERYARPDYYTLPCYWISFAEVAERLEGLPHRGWLLGWRDVTDARASARTVVACAIPAAGVNDKFLLLLSPEKTLPLLYANLLSFALDYAARQKVSGLALKYFTMRQLPVLPPVTYAEPCAWAGYPAVTLRDWLLPRVLELTYTAWDLEPFARDCGWFGPPFVWDEVRRFQLRCELDAAFLHLYGLSREEAAYILDTFPIVRRKDEAAHGTYRTKDCILENYYGIEMSIRTHQRFQSGLDPLPSSFRVCHRPRLPQTARTTLAGVEKYLLVFFDSFARHTREEASLDLLDAVFHLLRHREKRKGEIAASLGDDAHAWLAGFDDSLPNEAFLPFLKRLEADAWITINPADGAIGVAAQFPAVPFDEWRYYDAAAALYVISQRPDLIELVTSEKDASLSKREFISAKAM